MSTSKSIIAHEYFHNWTGNRITCRDWFQLCLKEGLTVFRDQEFTSDIRSRAVKRISDVKTLRARQFPEDNGPLAHPPRPSSYIEINNFYTPTVYEKGAEICRMMLTLIGGDAFRKAMDLYFERHDGEAATVEQFVNCMAEASGRDLSQFFTWYTQAGTPTLTVETAYDASRKQFTLTLAQARGADTRPGGEEATAHSAEARTRGAGRRGHAARSRGQGCSQHAHDRDDGAAPDIPLQQCFNASGAVAEPWLLGARQAGGGPDASRTSCS